MPRALRVKNVAGSPNLIKQLKRRALTNTVYLSLPAGVSNVDSYRLSGELE